MIDIKELKEAVACWKEAVKWISKGWDCIEEYTLDLSYRGNLQDLLDKFSPGDTIPQDIAEEIARIDRKFISVTEKSDLCVWDCGPKFCYCDENNIELLPINAYDKYKYWFYYRWQPDCDISWKDIDAETYQKELCGLDFARMSHDQLIEAVKKVVAKWKDQIEKMEKN